MTVEWKCFGFFFLFSFIGYKAKKQVGSNQTKKLHNKVSTAHRWEKIFTQTQSGKGLKSQIFKLKQFTARKQITQL